MAPRHTGRPSSSRRSSSAKPQGDCSYGTLAEIVLSDVKCHNLTVGRFAYVDVVTGKELCSFVQKYYRDSKGKQVDSEHCAQVCRKLQQLGVFKIVDKDRDYRPREFLNDSNCLCVLNRPSSPPDRS